MGIPELYKQVPADLHSFRFPAIPGLSFISKLCQFVAGIIIMRQFHDSYKSNFWQIFSIWPNCAPLAPTHSSHSLLNRQRFVEVDLCWPLHARLAHIYLPSSLPFPFTYYVLDLGITIYNAAYAKQTHSKNVSKNLSSSLHNCLHS